MIKPPKHLNLPKQSHGVITDLGTLGGRSSAAYGINDAGQVVGGSSLSGDSAYHATLWDHGTVIDLNSFLDSNTVSAGWVLDVARGINDRGWIVGSVSNTIIHASHAFVLADHAFVILPSPIPLVPEPETYAMFMAGLGLMGFMARRRKNGQA
jgi:probable HAF family extracellular repeat protein